MKLGNDATPLHSTWSRPKSFARLLRPDSKVVSGVDAWDAAVNQQQKQQAAKGSDHGDDDEAYEEVFEYDEDDPDFQIEVECNRLNT